MPAPTSKRKPNFLALLAAVVLSVAGVAAIVASFSLDAWTREQVLAWQGKDWKKSPKREFVGAISKYGDWPELMILGAAGLFLAHRARSREWKRILIAAMVASTIAGVVANASRLTTGRTRPRESPKIEQGWYGPFHDGKLTIGNSKFNSFPSGHTATAFGFAGVLLFARPWLGLLAVVVASTIAWSRMALGAHHFSDVVVALILSLLIAWLVWRYAVQRGDELAARVREKLSKRRPAT